MKKKKDNNLIAVIYNNGETQYYTSLTRAGLRIGLSSASVQWAIKRNNICTDLNDREFTIEIVDGSEIPYKLINN